MQVYDASTKQGICQEIDRLCDTTDTTYSRQDKTARLNQSYEEVVGWLIKATNDGWQFDDSNYTTLPEGTINLQEGVASYSFSDKLLAIQEISILDSAGIYQKITPIDESQLGEGWDPYVGSAEPGMSWEQFFGSTKGFPRYYDKRTEDTIKLGPAPSSSAVTLAAGLKVRFRRTAQLFTVLNDASADTTVPGFASPYHVILAYMAAIPYCAIYHPERVPMLMAKVGNTDIASGMKKQLLDFYGQREQDRRPAITPRITPYI